MLEEVEKLENLGTAGGNAKSVQPLWKTVGRRLTKFN